MGASPAGFCAHTHAASCARVARARRARAFRVEIALPPLRGAIFPHLMRARAGVRVHPVNSAGAPVRCNLYAFDARTRVACIALIALAPLCGAIGVHGSE